MQKSGRLYMINERQKKIIQYLNEAATWKNGKVISQVMNVSDRTIRSDIESINRCFGSGFIQSNQKKGYLISKKVDLSQLEMNTQSIPQTPRERCIYILNKLLTNTKSIDLISLVEEIYISIYTLDNDLKHLRQGLETYKELQIIRSKDKIQLVGPEKVKRNLYKELLLHEIKGNFLNLNKIQSLYRNFDLLQVSKLLDETLKKYDYKLRDTSYTMFLMHVGISIERMLQHNYLETFTFENDKILQSIEYKIIREFYESVARHMNIRLIEDEIVSMSLLLMGKKSELYTDDSIVILNQVFSIKKIVNVLLEDIYQVYDIDLRDDVELNGSFRTHIYSLINRRIKNVNVDNLYLQEIKSKYPLAFDISIHAVDRFKRYTGLDVNENEIGFLALHLGSAYERVFNDNCIQTVLIYPHENSMNDMVIKQLEAKFGNRMRILSVMSIFEEDLILQLNPKLIISTVPLTHSLSIPTVCVSIFMSREDDDKIFKVLNQIEDTYKKKQFNDLILGMMEKRFFYRDVDAQSPEEVIQFLVNQLETENYVNSGFLENVLSRERISSTSFALEFAIPHALNNDLVNQSSISVLILRKPVKWGNYRVKLVILSAFTDSDRNKMKLFFEHLNRVITKTDKRNRLMDAKTYDEFVKIMKKN